MRSFVGVVAVAALLACGNTAVRSGGDGADAGTGGGGSTGGGTDGGNPGGPAVKHVLTVQVNGAGSVRSAPAGLDCASSCSAELDDGTVVTLLPTPAAGWQFDGFGGGCHGVACTLTLTADTTVWVTFVQLPPPPPGSHHVTVTRTGSGAGKVTSSPAGIDCGSTCDATFTDGTGVTLHAAPESGSTFGGWSGACSGTGDCTVNVSADTSVTARFDAPPPPPPQDDCAGIVPAALPTPVSVTVANVGSTDTTTICPAAISDGAGFVAAPVSQPMYRPIWNVYTSAGVQQKTFSAFDAFGQPAGFQWLDVYDHNQTTIDLYVAASDGSVLSHTAVAPYDAATYGNAHLSAPGGTVELLFTCDQTANTGTLDIARFDAQGNKLAAVHTNEQGCALIGANGGTAVVDANGRTMVVFATRREGGFGMAGNHLIARWYDAALAPLTSWIDLGDVSNQMIGSLVPLIGGGVAFETSQGPWGYSFASGSATPQAPPAFFPANSTMTIVRSNRAYAFTTAGSSSVDLWSASGKHCGNVTVAGATRLDVSYDGTIFSHAGRGGCQLTWYPAALR